MKLDKNSVEPSVWRYYEGLLAVLSASDMAESHSTFNHQQKPLLQSSNTETPRE
ncbi:MAG: hypothetical protein HRU21_07895 [Pseudomonadales bacterium]|nr:hypothetical protein [Pseudomonadales bacterium]